MRLVNLHDSTSCYNLHVIRDTCSSFEPDTQTQQYNHEFCRQRYNRCRTWHHSITLFIWLHTSYTFLRSNIFAWLLALWKMLRNKYCAFNLPENLLLLLFQVWISIVEVLLHRVCKTHDNFSLLYFACRSETSPEDSVKWTHQQLWPVNY